MNCWSYILKSIDQLGKRHVASNNWGLADGRGDFVGLEGERVRDPIKITPVATAWARYGVLQRGQPGGTATGKHNGEHTTGKHNDNRYRKKSYVNKIWKEKLNQLEMWFKQFWDMKSWFISNIFRWFSFMFSIAFEKLIDIYSDIQRVLTDIHCDI